MSLEYSFTFSQEDCIQCHGCEAACKAWRGIELGVQWRRVNKLWSGDYPNVHLTSTSVSCLHCADPMCVPDCPVDAITKRPEDGVVVVDRDACIGCEACMHACPIGAPQFGKDEKMQKCDFCFDDIDLSKDLPPCVSTCPTKALGVVKIESQEKSDLEQAMIKMLRI